MGIGQMRHGTDVAGERMLPSLPCTTRTSSSMRCPGWALASINTKYVVEVKKKRSRRKGQVLRFSGTLTPLIGLAHPVGLPARCSGKCPAVASASDRLQRAIEDDDNAVFPLYCGWLGILLAAGLWLGGRRLLPPWRKLITVAPSQDAVPTST